MRKWLQVCLSLCLGAYFLSGNAYGIDNKWEDLVGESDKILKEMVEMPESGIPKSLLRDCKGVAIFPNTVGGGFVFGGKWGQGVILLKDKGKWGTPAVFDLGGASFGWQIGGQAVDIILLVMNERGVDGLLKGKVKLGGDASVSAGPFGRDVEASADVQMKSAMLAYSRSRGLFIGIKLEGAFIGQNNEANKALYGGAYSAKDILLKKAVNPTANGIQLIDDLNAYSK